jgi:predicted O-linked N-acetylglucosamine transferase (SPINDLY family)
MPILSRFARALRRIVGFELMDQLSLGLRFGSALEHHRRGEREQAERLLQDILAAEPRHAQALQLAGFLALEKRRFDEAIDRLARSIRYGDGDGDAGAHLLLGRAYKGAGQVDGAIASYRRAIARDGNLVDAHVSLGIALRAKGENDEAARSYRRALALNPASFEAHLNLANLAFAIGDFAVAATHYERAERLRAVSGETRYQHGKALWRLGRKSEAAEQIERAVSRDPDLLEAYLSLAEMLYAMAQHEGALTYHRALIARLDAGAGRPGDVEERTSLRRDARLGCIDALIGCSRHDEALELLEAEIAAWGDTAALLDRLYWVAPYRFDSQDDVIALSRRFHRVSPCASIQPLATTLRTAEPERLRIGYMSADFREHSVAYFVEPLLAGHDRARFTVVCYSSNAKDDGLTTRLRGYADEWMDVQALTNRALAERIAADRIDILVDLSGRTLGGRPGAFAFRPACLQLTYLGFPTVTGFEQFDFRVTDAVIDPEDSDDGLPSERPLRLPGTMFCYRPPSDMPDPLPRRTNGPIRFGSFNQAPKLSPRTLQAWAAILRETPSSVLLLKAYAFRDAPTRQRVLDALVAHGIAADRIEIRPPAEAKRDHFAAYRDIDVALDTFPYNGATTTCEALWMGVPVVSLVGNTHPQRMGASLLGAIGLDDLVARSPEEYVRIAVALARDEHRRAELRSTLRSRFGESSLRDEREFVRGFETVVREAWRLRLNARHTDARGSTSHSAT